MDAPLSPSEHLNLDSDVANEPARPIRFDDERPETLPSSPPVSTGYDEEKAFCTLRNTSENRVYQVLNQEDIGGGTGLPALTRNAAWNDAHVNKANIDRRSSNYTMSSFTDPQDNAEFANIEFANLVHVANIEFANLVHATSTYLSQEEPQTGNAIEAAPRSPSSSSDEMLESPTHSGAFMHTSDINSNINLPLFGTDEPLPPRNNSERRMKKIVARCRKRVSLTMGERDAGVNVAEAFAVIASTQEVKEPSRPVRCSEGCEQSFNSYKELAQHLVASPGHRPFVCSEEDCIFSVLGFPFKSICTRHILIHHTGGAYKCEICDSPKYFSRIESLRRHTLVAHTKSGKTKNKRLSKKKRQ